MSCYSPLQAFKGKSKNASKISIVFSRPDSWRGVRLDLPCGQCIGCRLEKSRQWAVRCMHEASLYDDNSFITLTYSDKFLPSDGSLKISHFQDFMKRLRKSVEPKRIRFYHCGEYGESFGRPHYHALLFNHSFSDLKLFKRSGESDLFTSDSLSNLWTFGHSIVGELTFRSAAYVARYVMKKVTGKLAEDHYMGRQPEYTTMSRRPGIGKGWYDKFKDDVYPLDRVIVRGRDTRPPRFYDNLLGIENSDTLKRIKIDREKRADRFVSDVLSNGTVVRVSDNDSRRLLVREEVKKAEISNLKRLLEE